MTTKLEAKFLQEWEDRGLPSTDMVAEYRFDDERKWRFDFAWPSQKIAVELSGIGYGHQSIKGISRDAEKLRRATFLGWRVLTYTSACLGSRAKLREAVEEVSRLLCGVNERVEEGLSSDFASSR